MENEIGLKLQFYADGEGGVLGEYSVPKQFEGYPGIAHGGIVATMLDEALIRAFLLDDPNRLMGNPGEESREIRCSGCSRNASNRRAIARSKLSS